MTLRLPDTDLFQVRSAVHSPDLQWLAISVRDRGILWNLRTDEASGTTGFDSPYISPENVLSAYFDQRESTTDGQGDTTVVYRGSIDLGRRQGIGSEKVSKSENARILRKGKYSLEVLSPKTPNAKRSLGVKDNSDGRALWSRVLQGEAFAHLGNALVLQYDARDTVADRLIKQSPELKRVFDTARSRDDLSLLEVLSLDKGDVLGRVLIEDGGRGIRSINIAGRILFVEDANNRTLAYSLDSGLRTGQQFGRVLAVDSARGLVAVENQPGGITVFNGSMRSLAAFEFPRNVTYAGFDGAGKRLLVLTGAQEVFIENIPE